MVDARRATRPTPHPPSIKRAMIAIGGTLLVNGLIFAGFAYHRVRPPAPPAAPVFITVQRERMKPQTAQQGPAQPRRRQPASHEAGTASPEGSEAPATAFALPALPSLQPPTPAQPPQARLKLGCLGRDIDQMSPAERSECERDRLRQIDRGAYDQGYGPAGRIVEADRKRQALRRRVEAWRDGPAQGTVGKDRHDGPPLSDLPIPRACGTYDPCR